MEFNIWHEDALAHFCSLGMFSIRIMKVLHLSTSDVRGGAARAAYRLHQGLNQSGISSQMLVRAKDSIDRPVIASKTLRTKIGPLSGNLPLRRYPNRSHRMFSAQWFPDTLSSKVKQLAPDIVNLHWVCNGFLRIETLAQIAQPLVWTLHDMWPFTGGCHYAQACERYQQSCGHCPQLKSDQQRDLSRRVWQRKAKAWRSLNLTIVSPSQWLADCARQSTLFQARRIEVIPHGLDLTRYKPIEQSVAKRLLNLPDHKQLVLFGASPGTTGNARKGFQLLQQALDILKASARSEDIELVVFGANKPSQPVDLGFKIHYLGQLHDDVAIALVYSAASVMVVPSTQEAYGQTASEALACGTPVVTFRATGLKDIVEHRQTGYLADPFDVKDLAKGIAWVLSASLEDHRLSHQARQSAEALLSQSLQTQRYQALYQTILSG